MKKIRGLFVALVLTMAVFSVTAQNDQNALREVVEQSTYGDNWFISLGGNANLLVAEQDGFAPFTKRLKFGGTFDVGKWFNPNFGARIQVMGGQLRGFQNINPLGGYYVINNYDHSDFPKGGDPRNPANQVNYKMHTTKNGVNGFWQDLSYASATFDLLANFTNLARGYYKEGNFIDVIPFAGVGAIYSFNNVVTDHPYYHFVAKIGVRLNFNVANNFAIYLEPQASATTREFDGFAGDAFGDGIVNLGLGVQYTFNKKFDNTLSNFIRLTADEVDRLNRKINSNRYLIENHQDILERQQKLLEKLEECCEENKKGTVTQIVETSSTLPEYVRFGLDSYKIEPMEQVKISDAADYLKKNPNSKILIIGYADRKTGNPRYNLNLSQRRVSAVAAELKRLGISDNRIISEWKGDVEQPFPQNEWNRVVIMVERK
jgi:outer membrane protein OmpA-like peptidoglycan-associated protein